MDKLLELIEEGEKFDFYNNSDGPWSRATAEYRAWAIMTEDFIRKNYGKESPPYKLYRESSKAYFDGYLRFDFEKNHSIILQALKLCKKVSPKNENDSVVDDEILNIDKTSVFIVHGHDAEIKEKVARTLLTLKLNPIILHEKPNEGKTIIEKFEKHSKVGFAIILLTNDDEGKSKTEKDLKARARQNVILEWGYFIGKLGREKVVALYQSGVELPSDLSGLVYIPIDSHDGWKMQLVRELKSAGYKVNADDLF